LYTGFLYPSFQCKYNNTPFIVMYYLKQHLPAIAVSEQFRKFI